MLRFINRASLFQTKASILSSKNFCTTPSQPEKFKVLFFGTDIIAKTVLEALHKNLTHQFKKPVVEKLAVVTSPDITGKKKQQPVKIFCEEKRIGKA